MGTFPESYTDTKKNQAKDSPPRGEEGGGGLGCDNGGSTYKGFAVICL